MSNPPWHTNSVHGLSGYFGVRRTWVDLWDRHLRTISPLSIPVFWNSRWTRIAGQCRVIKGGDVQSITLHSCLIDHPTEFRETFAHEVAHASVHLEFPHERHDHDWHWKKWAILLGAKPEACCQLKALEIVRQKRARWSAECLGCGHVTYRMKAPTSNFYWHPACGALFGNWKEIKA